MITLFRCLLVRYIPFNALFSFQFSGGLRPIKLKYFNIYKSYIAIANKERNKQANISIQK